MAKQHLLLVDGDAKSLRVMEVSLKKAGFQVTTAIHGKDALEKVQISLPDLVLSETRMPEMDGFELCKVLKSDERFRHIPYVFLTSQKAVESKVKGLETGAEDYLTKPIYIKEVVTRVRMILAKVEKERFEKKEQRAGFSGNLSDMGVVDLVQTFEIGRKTGVIQILGDRQGTVYFKEGRVIDAELGRLRGENAFYRMLNTFEGQFEVSFAPVERAERIEVSTQGLLMEGMRRLDEWGRMLEQLPPLETVFELDYQSLADRLAEIPDEVNGLLRLFDGRRTLQRVVEDSDFEDLAALGIISKLYFEGLIREVGTPASAGERPRKPGIEEWLNTGPNPVGGEAAPATPSVTATTPLPPAVSPAAPAMASIADQLATAEPELPPLGVEEAVELPLELDPLPAAPAVPPTAASPAPPAIAPVSPAAPVAAPPAPPKPQVPVVHFEPRPRVPGQPPAPALDPAPAAPPSSQFLVEKAPSELERARASLLDAWAKVDSDGFEGSATWAPMSGWSKPPPLVGPAAAHPVPATPGASPPLAEPVFGGAAKERFTLPPLKPEAVFAPAPIETMPVEPLVEPEPVAPPSPATPPPSPHSTPPTRPPAAAQPPPPAALPAPSFSPSPAPRAPSGSQPSPVPQRSPDAPTPSPAPQPPPLSSRPSQAPVVVPTVGPEIAPPLTAEDEFFEDTVGSNSQPFSGEHPIPSRSKALPIVVVLGLVLGVVGTIVVMNSQDSGGDVVALDAGSGLVVPPIVQVEVEDAGLTEDVEDDAGALVDVAAGPDAGATVVVEAPRDAGAPEADAGAPAKDAGVVVATDAGVPAKDAGLAAVDAGVSRDAGAAVAVDAGAPKDAGVSPKDAGVPTMVATADAGVAPAGGTLTDAEFATLLEEGKGAIVAEKWGKAVQTYRKATKDRPTDPEARTGLGISLVFSETGFREAIPHLKEATKVDPSNARAWLALGIALQNLGRDAEAKQPYRKFLELNPKGAQADEVRMALQAIP
ncbi:MAG: response regulator [Myxococcaceae bacterium]|nr:response regulator [Myxococcaceae bacterium]